MRDNRAGEPEKRLTNSFRKESKPVGIPGQPVFSEGGEGCWLDWLAGLDLSAETNPTTHRGGKGKRIGNGGGRTFLY